MDENTIKIEFNGRTIACKPLMESQFTALQMLKHTKDEGRVAHLLFRVLESRVGPDQWEEIEIDMATGIEIKMFMDLIETLIKKTAEKLQSENDLTDGDDAEEIRKAEALLARHRKSDA